MSKLCRIWLLIHVQISWRDKRLDSRMGARGPLAHLRSGVSLQEVGYVCWVLLEEWVWLEEWV